MPIYPLHEPLWHAYATSCHVAGKNSLQLDPALYQHVAELRHHRLLVLGIHLQLLDVPTVQPVQPLVAARQQPPGPSSHLKTAHVI